MKQSNYLLEIAGLKILVSLPFPLQIKMEAEAFIKHINEECAVDITYTFVETESLEVIEKDAYHIENRWYVNKDGKEKVYFSFAPNKPIYLCANMISEYEVECKYIKKGIRELRFSTQVIDFICLDLLMIHFQGIILHSSFIEVDHKAILFSAPSGTGKSTQAALWERYENARIINGDRSILRKLNTRWYAHGLPYAGSSEIYLNESYPIQAIVMLKQGKTNEIRRLKGIEALKRIYPEILVHHFNQDYINKAMDLILGFISEIPVYELSCLPDKGAVTLLKETLKGE